MKKRFIITSTLYLVSNTAEDGCNYIDFYDENLKAKLDEAILKVEKENKATIFSSYVDDPSRFGIIEFSKDNKVISIEEKPVEPKSNYCVTGLYFYPSNVINKAKSLKPSNRNELEITDLNNLYLKEGSLEVTVLDKSSLWIDAGTCDSLLKASNIINKLSEEKNINVACLEEIAFKNNWITKEQLIMNAKEMESNKYGAYLFSLIMKE